MATAAAAIVAGLTATVSVPVIALHEVLIKRHKAQMRRHLPQATGRVSFASVIDASEASHAAAACAAAAARQAARVAAVEAKRREAEAAIAARVAPARPALRRPRSASPPPAYDSAEVAAAAPCLIEELIKAPEVKPCVRFAARA